MKPLSLAAQQAHPQEICHGACSARGDVRFWGLGGSRLTAIPDDCGSGKAGVAVQLLSVLLNLVMVFSIVLWCCKWSALHCGRGVWLSSQDLSGMKQ